MSDVTIVYCRPCGYEKRAKDAAAALRRHLALESHLVPGKGGVFQVKLGDRIVASRSKGHFPGTDEIVAAVTAARH
ncbi:SelT/SelW/SelH family protein [Bradyrhizobium sp. CSA207]|uniref:Rdx family protein n=1 Tax=Bradyrhizobium sp. CSA207 TaxID=2698826 RepID=UPI0023B19BE6|nr:Rdx family protein [Bradyrhizobium sp. CSA207]MDE5440217.1 SelT/SelW/SelH family protein [Bradyrhizobium sp. CSA207]